MNSIPDVLLQYILNHLTPYEVVQVIIGIRLFNNVCTLDMWKSIASINNMPFESMRNNYSCEWEQLSRLDHCWTPSFAIMIGEKKRPRHVWTPWVVGKIIQKRGLHIYCLRHPDFVSWLKGLCQCFKNKCFYAISKKKHVVTQYYGMNNGHFYGQSSHWSNALRIGSHDSFRLLLSMVHHKLVLHLKIFRVQVRVYGK